MMNPTTPGAALAAVPGKTCGHEGARRFGSSDTRICRPCVRDLRRFIGALIDDPNIGIEAGEDLIRDRLMRMLGRVQ
ncbi:hypothetical protein [Candidatus Palauibacter sp.]|uniref:hypothetical protein n=1 Tax=Candidatus Palauibacter sp. TaxID=3101350 RepID=UPI003B5BBFDD